MLELSIARHMKPLLSGHSSKMCICANLRALLGGSRARYKDNQKVVVTPDLTLVWWRLRLLS